MQHGKDPLATRLDDPVYLRAFEGYLEILTARAVRSKPRRRVVILSEPRNAPTAAAS